MMNTFILYITVMLFAGIIAAKVAEKIKISDVVLLLLLGVAVGPEALGLVPESQINSIGETIRELALIIIVFDAGYHLSWRILKREWFEVAKYTTIGCVFIMAASAAIAHTLFGIPYSLAFLFGAIISATDPSATLSILGGVKIPSKVKETLEAESIVNDPTGIILTYVVLDFITTGSIFGAAEYMKVLWVVAASFIVGIAGGILSGIAMKHLVKDYTVLFSLSVALATYVIAKSVGGSGIFASAIAGMLLGHQNLANKRTIVQFGDELAMLMKIGIFMYLGALINLKLVLAYIVPGILFALLLVLIIRPAMILVFANPKKFTLNERIYMGLLGPIAVVPAALAPLLLEFPGGEQVVGAVFTTIFASLLIVGGLLKDYNRIFLGVGKK